MKLRNISFNNLMRRKSKMIFLLIGLLIGISSIVSLLSVIKSMTMDIEERLDRFGANIVLIPKREELALNYGGISLGGVNYGLKEFNENRLQDILKIENKKNLGVIAPKVLGAQKLDGRDVLLVGADIKSELRLKNWWRLKGRAPSRPDELIIGSEVAEMFNLHEGDTVVFSAKKLRIAAVLHPTGAPDDGIILGDLHAIQKVLGKEGKVSMVEIAAFCRDCPISDLVLQIAEKFPDGKVTALKQAVMSKMQSIELIKSFSFGIAGLVILIGSLLVFITMMGSVNERTREIGIFRAIGFRRGHVMQIILTEAMTVGFLGGILGFFTGNLIAWAALPLVLEKGDFAGINFSLGGLAILLAVSLSLLASLYPAHKASKLDPSVALRAL
ncbi:ABC transporter permease [Thermodesulfobacteriota bacterium]